METPERLHVLIGSIRIPNVQSRPTLVVEAQADRIVTLRQQLGPMLETGTYELRHALLAASGNEEISWYRFNDTRLNGVVPLERLQVFYPNLQLIGHDLLAAESLADILNDWPAASQGQQDIDVTIAQGDPIQILTGAGAWLQRLQRVHLVGPRANEIWEECCDSWLQQHGFKRDPETQACWNLDPMAFLIIEHEAQIAALQHQHQQELRSNAEDREVILDALRHVFPYTKYRQLRPDIASFTDQDLVKHFVKHGMHEGVNLQFSKVESELEQLQAEQNTQEARLELLTEKSRHTSQQLDLLKDLFTRLRVNP